MRRWREARGGPVMRDIAGRLLARVTWTGDRWRGTVFHYRAMIQRRGSSSMTWPTLAQAIDWCEAEL